MPVNGGGKKIELDFTDARRLSFLPTNLTPDFIRDPNAKQFTAPDYAEDDNVFMLVADEELESRPMKKFCTNSKYKGLWNKLGIAGRGVYKYPHGVSYEGYFNRKGEFHGSGILTYPNGQKIEGMWKNGKLGENCTFITGAGSMNKNYCLMPDRRFQIEIDNGLAPASQEYLTDEVPPPRELPQDCYDLVEGYFDPHFKTVYKYPTVDVEVPKSQVSLKKGKTSSSRIVLTSQEKQLAIDQMMPSSQQSLMERCTMGDEGILEPRKISWIPSVTQENWIVKNCRKGWDEPTGYRPDLYEEWTTGEDAGDDILLRRESSSEFVSTLENLQLVQKDGDKKKKNLMMFVKNKKLEKENRSAETLVKIIHKMNEINEARPNKPKHIKEVKRI